MTTLLLQLLPVVLPYLLRQLPPNLVPIATKLSAVLTAKNVDEAEAWIREHWPLIREVLVKCGDTLHSVGDVVSKRRPNYEPWEDSEGHAVLPDAVVLLHGEDPDGFLAALRGP